MSTASESPSAQRTPRSPTASFGSIVLILLVLMALAAHWIAPYDPLLQDMGARLEPPTAAHLLLVSHDEGVIAHMCDRAALLRAGRIEKIMTRTELSKTRIA
jgi:ABC-type dipeptide/oligopeptide/nickel transport system permease subunit